MSIKRWKTLEFPTETILFVDGERWASLNDGRLVLELPALAPLELEKAVQLAWGIVSLYRTKRNAG
jgi:hypothetical protein